MARLLIFRGDLVDREIDLGVTSIRIGRGADNDVVLDDPEKGVSRAHAELRHEHGKYVLVDLGSQNGIFQDGARVERAVFRPNSAIVVGSFQLMIDEDTGWPAGDSDNAFSDATIVPPAGRRGTYAPADFDDPADSRAMGPAHGLEAKPSWMRANAKSLMLGGGVVALISAVGLGAWLFSSGLSTEETDEHLAQAVELIDQNEPQRAITEHLDKVLADDPRNEAALELKAQADEMVKRPEPSPPSLQTLPPPPPPVVGRSEIRPPPPPPGPSEPPQAVKPTVDPAIVEADRRAIDAQAAIDRGDLAAADDLIRGLPPSHARRGELQSALAQRRRANADGLARQAAEAARGGRLLEAVELYERAQKADSGYSVEPQLTDVRSKLRQEIDAGLARADVAYNLVTDVSKQEALRLYREVLPLMKDHPRIGQVRERIKELGGK